MKTIPFFFLIAASLSCFAQNKEPKNELGLNLYGIEIDVDFLGDGQSQNYYANGLQYKRDLNLHYKLRLSGQYFTREESGSMTYEPIGPSTTWNYITTTFEVRSGAERSFWASSKIRPFVFADLVYRKSKDKGTSQSSPADFGGGGTYDIDRTTEYGGVIGGLGVKYSPIPSIYFGLETSIGKYWQVFSGQQSPYSITLFSPVKTLVFGISF